MPTWVEIGLLAVAALSLTVTSLNLWRNRREVTADYRNKLFERQMAGCEALIATLDERHRRVTVVLGMREFSHVDAGHQEQARTELLAMFSGNSEYADVVARNRVFLPRQVFDAIEQYDRLSTTILAERYSLHPPQRPAEIKPRERLEEAFQEIVDAMRLAIGTDFLTRQAIEVIGIERDEVADSAKRRLMEAEEITRA